MRIGIEKFGDWGGLRDCLKFTGDDMSRMSQKVGKEQAQAFINQLRANIEGNKWGYSVDWRSDGGYALDFKGNYKGSFVTTTIKNGKDWKMDIRPSKERHIGESSSPISNEHLGEILESEYPHWLPTAMEFEGKFQTAMLAGAKIVLGSRRGLHIASQFPKVTESRQKDQGLF